MTSVTNEELLERRRNALGYPTPLFYEEPLQLVRGEGVWVYDSDGRRYLDVYNNVPHVGHCHPRVVDALCHQARIINVHTRYLHENVVRYGERLTSTFDPGLSNALFVCTGTEANELAIRIARHHSGKQGVIVTSHSYHGNSATLASVATGIQVNVAFPEWARMIHVPDLDQDHEEPVSPQEVTRRALMEVDEAIASLQAAGFGVAALLVDTLFSTEGLLRLPPGYLEGVVERVRAAGGFYIADEVQPGFGRTGDAWWGYQAYGVVPDFVTMGKSMGNGHPIGGVVTRPDLAHGFLKDAMYFNTFGGNPVSAAVGMALLDVIEGEHLIANARTLGTHIQKQLFSLANEYECIEQVRGKGLFFGIELVNPDSRAPDGDFAKRLINEMKRRGVLVSTIGPHGNVLKMRPPMVFDKANADLMLEVLNDTLTALGA